MQYASILIVEDDPIASTVLATWARQLGANVTEVGSTSQADSALGANDYDLILSDVHLAGNERLQWIERLLAADFCPPVLLITGNPELETTLRAANLPIAGYLVKPPDLKALAVLVQRLVTEYRHRVELRALSREAAWLLTTPDCAEADGSNPLRDRLLHLARSLAAEAGRNPRESVVPASHAPWHDAINETIVVLEKTKHSFRSRELGQLRQRLQLLLERHRAA